MSKTDDTYRKLAKERYAKPSNDDVEIDDNARVSKADDGAWVQAWVWIPDED